MCQPILPPRRWNWPASFALPWTERAFAIPSRVTHSPNLSSSIGRCGKKSYSIWYRTLLSTHLTAKFACKCTTSEAGAELVVADTGTGIPPEALPQLFNRFYRVPGASGRTHEGSGIGLSLVRELVRLHGGSIEVESHVGQGSIFRVSIPFGAAHLPHAQVAQEDDRLASVSGAQAFVEEAQRWLPDFANLEQSGDFLALARPDPLSGTIDSHQ